MRGVPGSLAPTCLGVLGVLGVVGVGVQRETPLLLPPPPTHTPILPSVSPPLPPLYAPGHRGACVCPLSSHPSPPHPTVYYLQDLTLVSNQMTLLPDCICDMVKLTRLTVDSNYLERLPRRIGNLTRLKFLSAGRNRITHIPSSIVQLTALKSLILYQNRLGDRGLPDCLCDMGNLRELRLSYNAISRLPYRFTSGAIMRSLRILWLYGNCFFDLGDLPLRLSTIRDLRLDINPLKSPPPAVTTKRIRGLIDYTSLRVFRIRDIQRRCEAEGWVVNPQRMVPTACREGRFIVGT